MNLIVKWVVSTIIILAIAFILPGVFVDSILAAIIAALVLGLLNVFIKPILIFLTLPLNILTLGLFGLVINAVIIILADKLVSGFGVENFWWALLMSLILSLLNSIVTRDNNEH